MIFLTQGIVFVFIIMLREKIKKKKTVFKIKKHYLVYKLQYFYWE